MKLLPLLLAGTLTGNAVLVGIHLSRTTDGPTGPDAVSDQTQTSSHDAQTESSSQANDPLVAEPAGRSDRAALSALDPGTLAQRLREAGFPADIVATVERMMLYETYGTRRAALVAGAEDFAFWKPSTGMNSTLMTPEIRSSMREIDRELQARLKEIDAEGTSGSAFDFQRRRFGDLPVEKLRALQTIESDYNELRNDVFSARTGVTVLPADQEKLALLEREQRADFAKILTPDELFEYDIRNSPTANRLRSQLQGFTPSEAEFRAVFKVQRALEEQAGIASNSFNNPSSAEGRTLRAALLKELQGTLPPERLADLETVTDPAQSMLSRLTARLQLPLDAARQVAAVQRDTQRQVAELRANRELAPIERDQRLAAVNAEATAKVTAALGPRGVEAYREFGGSWLQVPSSITPATPALEAPRPGTTR